MLSAQTRGLEELASFRARVANDFGVRRSITFQDLMYINDLLDKIEERMVEIASNDKKRLANDERVVA
jgi:hypothetical protein